MNAIRRELGADHQALAALLENLLLATHRSDREALQATWGELEGRLIRHFEAEEKLLFPLLEASHPHEVQQTRAEHAALRDRLSELGVAVELHSVREPDIRALVAQLDEHARREERDLYALADDRADRALVDTVTATLKAAVRTALRRSPSEPRARS